MKASTIGGAFIAASIGFLTGFLALINQEGVNSVSEISEIAWVTLAVGSALAFLKDFQALTVRRGLDKISGGDE